MFINFKKIFENYPYSDHDPYKNYFYKIFKKLKYNLFIIEIKHN